MTKPTPNRHSAIVAKRSTTVTVLSGAEGNCIGPEGSRVIVGAGPVDRAGGAGGGGLLEMLGGALDRNREGSPLDDITGMLGRSLGRN